MAISTRLQTIQPGPEHGALAIARALALAKGGGQQSVEAVAQALGFQSDSAKVLQHQDGSWIKFTAGKAQGGYQAKSFSVAPADLLALQEQPWGSVPTVSAIRGVRSSGNDLRALRASLTRAGFNPLLPNYFAHADGSWVALVEGHVLRGYGQVRYGALPPALARQRKAADRAGMQNLTPAQLVPDQAAALPSVNAKFADGYLACGRVGNVYGTAAEHRRRLKTKGFVENTRGTFVHPDGSWVAFAANRAVAGLGMKRFAYMPQPPGAWSAAVPGARELGSALSDPKVAALTPADFQGPVKALLNAGFAAITPFLYKHADGSLVACVDKAIHFAHRNRALKGPAALDKLPVTPLSVAALLRWHKLGSVDPKDAAAVRKALAAAGFREPQPDFFVAGTRWVKLVGTKVVAGEGGAVLSAWPSLAALPKGAPIAIHTWHAIARTAKVKKAADLAALGFKPKAPGFYAHSDGSWVSFQGQQVVRGVDGQVLTSLPKAPKPGQYAQFTSKPPGSWIQWRQRFAVARVPRADGSFAADEVARCLAYLGFINSAGATWKHADGSQVTTSGGSITGSRFQQWGFGDFPYQNGTDGTKWATDTREWLAWAKGTRKKAPYDPV